MVTVESRSLPAGLEKKQKALHAELRQIDEQINQEEEAQARIEQHIEILEQGRRQAA